MKVEQGSIVQLKLTEVEGLDPVHVMIEEYNKGAAKVVVECYGESWSSYWGSMGGDLIEFFTRTSVDYLVNCFERGIRSETGELDTEATKASLESKLKSLILENRREERITFDEARYYYDNYISVFLYDLNPPEHTYGTYSHWDESSWYNLFGSDNDDMQWWLEENTEEVYELNHKYEYLGRIVAAVQEAVITNYKPMKGRWIMKTPDKVEQLFIRACKSNNPYLRVHSIYNRFYLKGAKPEIKTTVIIGILSDIVDEYCPLRTANFLAGVLGQNYTTAFLPLEKRVLMELVHQIANSKASCFGEMRRPLWARIRFGGE